MNNGLSNINELEFRQIYKDSSENTGNLDLETTIKINNGAKLDNVNYINGNFTLDIKIPDGESLEEGNYIKTKKINGNVNLNDDLIRLGYRVKQTDEQGLINIDLLSMNTSTETSESTNPPSVTNKHPNLHFTDNIEINVGDKFDPLAIAKAKDQEDGDITLTDKNILFNHVDTSKAGEYKVKYEVIDKDGGRVTKVITVVVKEVSSLRLSGELVDTTNELTTPEINVGNVENSEVVEENNNETISKRSYF